MSSKLELETATMRRHLVKAKEVTAGLEDSNGSPKHRL